MTDIVELARKYSPYDYEPGSQVYREANLRHELIAEIERLRGEINQLREILGDREAEIGRMRAMVAQLSDTLTEAQAEIEQLRSDPQIQRVTS